MADLDTREKRASGWNVLGPIVQNLPLPDASVDDPDRQQTAYSYAGIAADAPPAVLTGGGIYPEARRNGRR